MEGEGGEGSREGSREGEGGEKTMVCVCFRFTEFPLFRAEARTHDVGRWHWVR